MAYVKYAVAVGNHGNGHSRVTGVGEFRVGLIPDLVITPFWT